VARVLDVSHVAVRVSRAAARPATVRVCWTPVDAAAWTVAFSSAQPAMNFVARHLPQRLPNAVMWPA
jgi:hypothetical protein